MARAIVFALRQADTRTVVAEVCRNRTAEAEENQQLKQLVADLSLDKQMLQEVIKKML